MFGYITPMVCELKVREYELFQAYYCGLCKALKNEYARSSVLNYDCTFIYLLGDSLAHDSAQPQACGCFLHPIKKKQAVHSDRAAYAAAVNILMAYAKARDDTADEGGVLARLKALAMRGPYKKAAAHVPGITRDMLAMAEALRGLEARGSADTDAVADTYARLFGNVLMELDVVQSHILYEIGYSLGRWVYLIDAYDDIQADIRHGSYNVFVKKYHIQDEVSTGAKQEIEFGFHFTLSRAMQALERLELRQNRALLQNIVCLGLKQRTRQVMGTQTENMAKTMDTGSAGQSLPGGEPDEPVSGVGR